MLFNNLLRFSLKRKNAMFMLTVITDEDVKQALIDFLNKNGSLPEGFGPNL
jgi:hypothetical protein